MPRVVFHEESKTGLGFEIRHRQKNADVHPMSTELMGNPAVVQSA